MRWLDALPDAMHGVVVGNEVLDAMPVQLLHWDGARWLERGVVATPGGFAWQRPRRRRSRRRSMLQPGSISCPAT